MSAEPIEVSGPAVADRVRSLVAALLGLPGDAIRTDVPLSAYGIDSKSVMEVVVGVEGLLQMRVDPDLFLHGRTIDQLGEDIAWLHAARDARPPS